MLKRGDCFFYIFLIKKRKNPPKERKSKRRGKSKNMPIIRQRSGKMNNIDFLNQQDPSIFLQRDNSGRGLVCPYCGNGTGNRESRGLEKKYYTGLNKNKWTCFSSCGGKTYDVVDLIKGAFSLSSQEEAIRKGLEIYGTPGQSYAPQVNEKPQKETEKGETTTNDYTAYYQECRNNNDFLYLQGRGISKEVQESFWIGLDESWRSPKALREGKKPPRSKRCIIPFDSYHYEARATEEINPNFKKMKEGDNFPLFNSRALEKGGVVFVTEGAIDCLSIIEAGYNAIALGSTSNKEKLLDYLRVSGERSALSIVLMLDNDNAGTKTTEYLLGELKKVGVSCISATIPSDKGKDPNEYLVNDRAGFSSFLSSLQGEAMKEYNALEKQEATVHEYNALELLDYFKNMESQPDSFEAKTGFNCFDDMNGNLYGGLHEGLYIIGAISSLGKTTFCLQLADQIAERGTDVIFFSLEMSKYELMAKSISRFTYNLAREKHDFTAPLPRVTSEILNNRHWKFLKDYQKQHIQESIKKYEASAKNLYIYEGRYKDMRLGVAEIKKIVNDHYRTTGRKPVIFVDYLQIIAPADIKSSDKQNTDTAVFELKELSRNLGIPVIAISSFNRDNYKEPVSMVSFKESGAIEYSSDVLLGLQYQGMDYQKGETATARNTRINTLLEKNNELKKTKEPVNIQLKCLKNRNGNLFSANFTLIHAYNRFCEYQVDMEKVRENARKKNQNQNHEKNESELEEYFLSR